MCAWLCCYALEIVFGKKKTEDAKISGYYWKCELSGDSGFIRFYICRIFFFLTSFAESFFVLPFFYYHISFHINKHDFVIKIKCWPDVRAPYKVFHLTLVLVQYTITKLWLEYVNSNGNNKWIRIIYIENRKANGTIDESFEREFNMGTKIN